MKVDTSKLKKSSSELTPECRLLIDHLTKFRSKADLSCFLETINVWTYGKCELYHWTHILDRFDKILEEGSRQVDDNEFMLYCDIKFSNEDVRLLLLVLNFTTLLIEHSFSRHLYNSVEHLTQLLSSQNMDIVLAVLNLLYMFSKRSNFIPRLSLEKKDMLLTKLYNIAERWGDPNYGLALIDCCIRKPKLEFLYQLSIEYSDENGQVVLLEIPDMLNTCKGLPISEVVKAICGHMKNPSESVKMRIAHRIRLVSGFKDQKLRLQFVQARLQAISVLIYSNALQENVERILYSGFGEELCELIDKEDVYLVEIRAAVLRTLTSMLHFDRNPNVPRPGSRLSKIIQYTGAERQGGILPLLVRDCITSLTHEGICEKYPLVLATSLFSLLYHLASYEAGGHALVKSGMMKSLLQVINWPGVDLEHITFVTRAVRVIDLITNIDISKFHQSNGLNIFIDRMEKEIKCCRNDLANPERSDESVDTMEQMTNDVVSDQGNGDNAQTETFEANATSLRRSELQRESRISIRMPNEKFSSLSSAIDQDGKKLACVTQRAALLKSMLNFLKKSIQDHAHFNGMRNIMESSLPKSLQHIISNAEYYGPSLFLLATDVVTVYVFNEPSLLSSLQETGLTNVILRSLLQKEVPATREILGSLPNIFSALCLNERGLMEFMSYDPFDKFLRVLLSPDYLVAMRRRRSSDPLGDTSTNLGNAMDDLMKHHPYLRTDAIESIVRLLHELVRFGSESKYICWRAHKDNSSSVANTINPNNQQSTTESTLEIRCNENDSSGEEEEDDDEMSSASQQQQRQNRTAIEQQVQVRSSHEREAIPLIDYILNVMKFIDAIFSNSSNGDHCREFVMHGGLQPLLRLLSLPNLPIDSPVSTTAQAVGNVCKSILNLAHETTVIDIALEELSKITDNLKPLISNFNFPGGSILLHELIACPKLDDGFSTADYTPLLHNMSSVHGYVVLLVHLCRNASSDMRLTLLSRWGTNSGTGLQLLQCLVRLYISLVWESTILLSLCSDEISEPGLYDAPLTDQALDAEKDETTPKIEKFNLIKSKIKADDQLRYIKSLLAASSRLGRALAELFGTLVKLSVGTPQARQRRSNDYSANTTNKIPTTDAKEIARVLSSILVNGFSHEDNVSKPAPKLKLTFLICSVGFTGPMLFDDKRSCFHLMISQFCEENGVRAFFDMFYWALSLDNSPNTSGFEQCLKVENILQNVPSDTNEYPAGTGEFIDAWMQLLEKMVNPRGILDSPYTVTVKGGHTADTIDFEPIFYLIHMHQLAMHVVRRIWKRKPIPNYGVSITETVMAILKHIIKSYNMISNRYRARLDEIQNADKFIEQRRKSTKTTDETYLNANHFKVLTDMGFGQKHVLDALRSTRSLEQATEFLLNHPEATTTDTQSIENISMPQSQSTGNEMDIDIELASTSTSTSTSNKTNEAKGNRKYKQSGSFHDVELLPSSIFNQFCNEVFERVFAFMEYLPETVNTGTELLSALYRQNNQPKKREFMMNLVKGVTECMDQIINIIKSEKITNTSQLENIFFGEISTKLLIRLKVSTILLDENYSDIRKEFCAIVTEEKSMHIMVNLLYETEALLKERTLIGVKPQAPQWLQNFIEFIDAIDNVCIILQRRENMRAVCSDKWRWYDVSTGKWNSYTESNNNLIKNAFAMGEKSQVINIGRQRYTVNFNCMTQVSEASGSHRSVLPDLKISEAVCSLNNGRNASSNNKTESFLTRSIRSKPGGEGVIYKDELVCLRSLTSLPYSKKDSELDKNVDYANATDPQQQDTTLSEEGVQLGQKKIKVKNTTKLSSKKNSGFSKHSKKIILHEELVGLSRENCIDIIACLVHLLQPELMVDFETKLAIMKLCARLTKDYDNAKAFFKNGGISLLLKMRQACGMMGFPTYAIVIIRHVLETPSDLQEAIERILNARSSPTVPVGHRDLVYLFTQVSSAVARHPTVFLMAAKQSLQVDNAMSSNFPVDDSRFLVKSQTHNKSSETFTNTFSKVNEEASEETVKELLRSIVQPCIHYGGVPTTEDHDDMTRMEESPLVQLDKSQVKLSSSKKYTESADANPCCCSWHIPSTSHTHQKPILPRSTLLKILADAVRSYQCLVPRIVMEYIYTQSDSPLITKSQSCISFILDQFLPITKRQQDPEVSMMSRVLLSSLSDCVSQPTVQSKLVEEIHEAIVRTLTEPNYTEKHVRLQVLIGLIPIMIESPMLSNKVHLQRNNMYRILLRQGVMTDLAKLAQYKDLSNSNTLTTIHSTLRPMEILLRLTITPGTLSSRRIFFGTPPNGSNAVVNRRLYPRLTSRTNNESSGSGGSEHVLRDIIRNVLSDRRQAFDFILNGEDIFLDSDDPSNSMATGHDESEDNERESHLLASTNLRPQINFDQLWDDLLQNGNVAFLGRSSNSNNAPADGSRIDTRNNRSDANQVVNAESGVSGGSDGASTSSELVAAVVDNSTSLLGDVSTSESESDSNASTENERNDEDEDDDDDEDGNEEDVDDHSETDADEETRQFIEVFDHIYEPESSETASNDADDEASEVSGRSGEQVINGSDADDETCEINGRNGEQPINASTNPNTDNRNRNSLENRETGAEGQHDILLLSQPVSRGNGPSSTGAANNLVIPSFAANNDSNRDESSVRTNPASVWVAPRLGSTRSDMNYTSNTESTSNIASNQEHNQNNTTVYVGSANNVNQTTSIGSFIQRRESTRRLILLDQQYCTLMPSFNNPTEEGQLDIFNQDSLHWWLEEAKHLDLESQTDACLYVAHLLIPFLIRSFKDSQKAKTTEQPVSTTTFNSPNRRSAIPVFIQQSSNSNSGSANISTTETTTERNENTALSEDIQDRQDQISNDDVGELDYSSEEENPTILVTNEDETIQDVDEDFEDGDDENNVNLNPTDLREEVNSAFDVQLGNEMRNELEQPPSEDMENLVSQASELFSAIESVDISSDNTVLGDIEDNAVTSREVIPTIEEHPADDITTPTSDATPTPMNAEVRAALGDLQVPEGVDPSFLAALPAEMREEVINEHLRMQRIRQRAQQNAIQVAHDSLIEVNPEFLAALPPNIQTEVLMQQRIEQQRQAASTANPDDPVDTAAFFQNLPESLRQAILTDMEESQIASLPPDLAAEAQYLRRDWESRNGPNVDTPHVLRRFPSSLQNLTDDSRWHSNSIWYEAHGTQQAQHHQHTTIVHQHQQQIHGKPIALLFMEDDNNLLDPDCLATILLFLFTEDTKINYTRFHRVIRNLCYHAPTRIWTIHALISIIQKTNEEKTNDTDRSIVKPHWLKIRIDAAFGYKSNVFIINEMQDKSVDYNSPSNCNISINPQAAQMVVKNCLDLLFVLARHFPRSFVPFKHDQKKKSELATESNENRASLLSGVGTGNVTEVDRDVSTMESNSQGYNISNISKPTQKSSDLKLDEGPSTSKAAANRGQKNSSTGAKSKNVKKISYNTNSKQFWDVLLKIDLHTPQRLGNMQDFPLISHPRWEWEELNQDCQSFNDTPFSKLLEMLPYKVICRSPQLTDMLVKLLASLSAELPKESDLEENKLSNKASDVDENFHGSICSEIKHDSISIEAKQYSIGYRIKNKLYSKNFSQLQLVTEVLTHQCGTVDGFDNISKLIVNLSQCSHASNAIFLEYLSSAVFGLAKEVRLAIQNLLEEIGSYKVHSKLQKDTKHDTASDKRIVLEGVMQDRFTSENVIISAPSNFKPSCELQLPSFKKLLSPSSAQLYFLKTLKIFIQVREIFYAEDAAVMDSANKKPTLSQIISLQDLWNTLSECLVALEESKDEYAVLVLQPTVEAFFLIHATNKKNETKPGSNIQSQNSTLDAIEETNVNASPAVAASEDNTDANDIEHIFTVSSESADNLRKSGIRSNPLEVQQRLDKENFLLFAEKHRTVLNQILRQSPIHLSDGPFAVLVDHTRILDFDVKRKYFQTELERIDEGVRREENTVSVRRVTVFEDSFRVLYRLGPEEWKNRFYIVFEDEEGQDAGGLLREWYVIISREIFNPMYALFCVSPGDRVTYMINPSSHANPNHLSYFKFVGRVIAKAIHDNKLLECYFTRSFYKHILGKQVKHTDMESQDYEFYKGLDYLMKNDISTLGYELTFSTEIQEFGVTQVRDLIPNGRNIAVNEENKFDYVQLVCQLKMSGSIRQQLDAFLEGFYDIIPKHLISIFNEQELELLISGLPDIDIEDLRTNTEYHKYTSKSLQIQWFWRALRSFDQADRAKFLQFVTGTSKVPLQGFGSLEGMNGIQRFQIHRDDRSTDRLPCAHTCFNQLDLPMYKSYEKLRSSLLKAIHECSEGFGFA